MSSKSCSEVYSVWAALKPGFPRGADGQHTIHRIQRTCPLEQDGSPQGAGEPGVLASPACSHLLTGRAFGPGLRGIKKRSHRKSLFSSSWPGISTGWKLESLCAPTRQEGSRGVCVGRRLHAHLAADPEEPVRKPQSRSGCDPTRHKQSAVCPFAF